MQGRSWSRLLALGLLIVAAASVLHVVLDHDKGADRRGGAKSESGMSEPPGVVDVGHETGEAEAAPAMVDLPDATPSNERHRGTGRLDLHFVDAATGHPVPDLGFIVFTEERSGDFVVRGRVDAEGRAVLESLPADVILVQTERRPPHSSTVDAVSLTEGSSVTREVRLGCGGAVLGRVVDDLGDPVEGATLSWNSMRYPLEKSGPSRVPIGATGSDGRFRIDHVLSTPRGIWIVDGELRPERWKPVAVWAEKDGVVAFSGGVHVGETEEKELPDLVLSRGGHLEGVVFRHDGTPAAGALVSAERSRFDEWLRVHLPAPGQPGRESSVPGNKDFALRPHEAVTGPDGAFEITVRPELSWEEMRWAVVVLPDLDHGFFSFSPVPPGETRAVKWRLDPAALVRFRIKSEGSPGWVTARDVHELQRQRKEGGASAGHSGVRGTSKLDALLGDGRRLSAEPFPMGEEWVARFEGAHAAELVELTLHLAFHDPTTRATDPVHLEHGPPLVFVVEPKTSRPLRLMVRLDGAEEGVERDYTITACLARDPGKNFMDCCGLGAHERVTLVAGKEVAVDFAVEHEGPFWVKVWSGGKCRGSLGPFATGEKTHDVAVVDPEATRVPADAARVKEPPPPSRPGDGGGRSPVLGRIHARLLDAETLDAVKEGHPREEAIVKPERGYMTVRFEGREHVFQAVAGSWTFRLRVHGYHPTGPFTVTVPPDGDVDLGEVLLEPLPRLRLRVLEHDGRPLALPNMVWVVAGSAPRDTRQFGNVVEGRVEVPEPPPSPLAVVAQVFRPQGLAGWKAQAIEVEYSSLEEEKAVRLHPWREIAVTARGIAPDHANIAVDVMVRYEHVPPGGSYAGNYGYHALPPADAAGTRFLHLQLAPGTHRLELESVLYSGSTEIKVRDTGEVQEFEVWARRR